MSLDINGRYGSPRKIKDSSGGNSTGGLGGSPTGGRKSGAKRWDRRTACTILGAALVAGSQVTGCQGNSSNETAESEPESRTDVPLRVLLVGSEADAEAIRLAWSMTMEQPLSIEVTERSDESETGFAERMKRFDVAIAPQSVLGEVADADAAVGLSDDLLQQFDQDYGRQFPAVEDGLGRYGGEPLAIGVGSKVFALLALDPEIQCETWADYHQWVKQLDGKAGEPLGKGWAAASFLNRCASTFSRGWLFNRNSMSAEIAGSGYVAVLEQLSSTATLYESTKLSPNEIWQSLRRGDLQGGIGFELSSDSTDEASEEFDISVFDCPRETESDRLWFGPQTPLASISSGCRQTDASKRFVGWLSGGERISSVRQQIDQFSITRMQPEQEVARQQSAYSRWLEHRLQNRQVVPALILPGADQYYNALDAQIIRCLDGQQSASDALTHAAAEWDQVTDKIGRKRQTRAWKRTLGFGA